MFYFFVSRTRKASHLPVLLLAPASNFSRKETHRSSSLKSSYLKRRMRIWFHSMKKNLQSLSKYLTICALSGMLLFSVWGCGKAEPIRCPYSDVDWGTTTEELLETKGEALSSYDSTYGGTTYTYKGSYKDREGVLKYMYDKEGVLMNIAFTYSASSDEDLQEFYDQLHKELVDTYGESGYDAEGSNNYGDVWRFDGGHIILSAMVTDSNKALQIAYVNPENEK